MSRKSVYLLSGIALIGLIFLTGPTASVIGSTVLRGTQPSNPVDQLAVASPNDWPTLQRNPQRTGYSPENVNPSYSISWTWNKNQSTAVRLSGKAQPIVSQGHVFIGGFDGLLYALDAATGAERWRFSTGGPVLHSAAADGNGKVYFGSDDKCIYAVDIATGREVWVYRTGGGVWVSPLVVNGTVFAGSRDGYFYAIDASNGALKWRFQTGGPILNTAAYSNGLVFFGSDDMFAYALRVADGTLQWKTKLPGQSFRDFWPVVAEKHNSVVFRTMPVYAHLDMIGNGFSSALASTRGQGFPAEKSAVVNYLTQNPLRKSLFVLDTNTGNERYVAPVLWTGGVGGPGVPPVIDASGDKAYVPILSNFGYILQAGGFYDFRSAATLAQMDLATGDLSLVQPSPAVSSSNPVNAFRLIGDETSTLSLGGSGLYVAMSQGLGRINLSSGALAHVIHETDPPRDGFGFSGRLAIFDQSQTLAYSTERSDLHIAPAWSPAVISNGTIFWKADGSALAAVRGQ